MLKTIVFCALAIVATVGSASASDVERNKSTVRDLFERAWSKGDFSAMESYWAPHVVLHFRGERYEFDLEDTKALINSWRTAFPDFSFDVHDLIGERDRVAIRLTYSGTHAGGDWFGIAPTGRAMKVTEMMFFRFEGGKIVEAWEDYDEHGMRQQLGAIPAVSAKPKSE